MPQHGTPSMRASLALPFALALPAAAQDRPPGFDEPIAGPGIADCAAVSGVENVMNLAQATDWAMGYLAGRMDAGHSPEVDDPAALTDPLELAFQIRTYCDENPYALVLDALRAYGRDVFAAGPMPSPMSQPRLPQDAPPARPAIWPPAPEDGQPTVVMAAAGASAIETRPAPRPASLDTTVVTRSPQSRSGARPLYDSVPEN